MDAIESLKQDHKRVLALIDQCEGDVAPEQLHDLGKQIVRELSIHAELEEKLVYPKVRVLPEAEANFEIVEALEQHHVIKLIIGELNGMRPDDDVYLAKILTLRDVLEAHIDEEEGEIFPMAERHMSKNQLKDLGRDMEEMRGKLEEQGPNLVVTMFREVAEQIRRMV
ncbi:MAG: hemerythrin domain-containing protein [Candidatus Sericytochromatia bacterium]|nr:hemerythrin domain-containing protein [Candidatus Tanganyikabacteria bacterium]